MTITFAVRALRRSDFVLCLSKTDKRFIEKAKVVLIIKLTKA